MADIKIDDNPVYVTAGGCKYHLHVSDNGGFVVRLVEAPPGLPETMSIEPSSANQIVIRPREDKS